MDFPCISCRETRAQGAKSSPQKKRPDLRARAFSHLLPRVRLFVPAVDVADDVHLQSLHHIVGRIEDQLRSVRNIGEHLDLGSVVAAGHPCQRLRAKRATSGLAWMGRSVAWSSVSTVSVLSAAESARSRLSDAPARAAMPWARADDTVSPREAVTIASATVRIRWRRWRLGCRAPRAVTELRCDLCGKVTTPAVWYGRDEIVLER